MPQAWRCVEGKVFNPNIYEDGTVEPKDLVGWGQELIFTSMNIFSVKEIGKSQQ
jgi:L-alanine-DL-glutamate epimerase-like enolase superfamily enzyme